MSAGEGRDLWIRPSSRFAKAKPGTNRQLCKNKALEAGYLLPCIFYGSSSQANSIDNHIRAAAVFVMHTRFLLLKSCSSKRLEQLRLLTMFETLHTCNYGERVAQDIRNH